MSPFVGEHSLPHHLLNAIEHGYLSLYCGGKFDQKHNQGDGNSRHAYKGFCGRRFKSKSYIVLREGMLLMR